MAHDNAVNLVAFSKDGKFLATASGRNISYPKKNALWLWKVPEGKRQFCIPHDRSINGIDFSPDGKYLATAGDEGIVRLWEMNVGTKVAEIAHGRAIYSVRFSPEGNFLCTAKFRPPASYGQCQRAGSVS
jgi:WD40 repeat protein